MPTSATERALPPVTSCTCEYGQAPYTEFESRELGVDDTEGRFAEVTLERCKTCRRLWLRYFVEYEAFSRSGRWARGLISEEDAASMTPEAAEPYLRSLDSYLY